MMHLLKWDAKYKDISDSDDEEYVPQRNAPVVRSEHGHKGGFPDSIQGQRLHTSGVLDTELQEPQRDILDSPAFNLLKAQSTVLLQSRDAKVLNNALSAISSIYNGLDNVQGYLFS